MEETKDKSIEKNKIDKIIKVNKTESNSEQENGAEFGITFFAFAVIALIINLVDDFNNKTAHFFWIIAIIFLIAWIVKEIVISNTRKLNLQLKDQNNKIIELQRQIEEVKKIK